MKAAFVRPQERGQGTGVVKAGELVDATYPDGASLSGAARKALVLLLAKAAGDAWQDAEFCITKGELRGWHQSNDRLGKVLDELQRTASAAKRPFFHRRLRLCWVGEELGASSRHYGRR